MRQKKLKLMAVVVAIVMAIAALVPTMAFAKSKPARPNGNRPTITRKDIRHNSMANKMRESKRQKREQRHEVRRNRHHDRHYYRDHKYYCRSRYRDYVEFYNYCSLLGVTPTYVPGVGYVYLQDTVTYPQLVIPSRNVPFLVPIR